MMERTTAILTALILGLTGCAHTDRAVFITASNVAINFDSKAQLANIGYDRTEGFLGPVHVEQGGVADVFASFQSNLALFSPKIEQVYATGKAARLVTSGGSLPSDGDAGSENGKCAGVVSPPCLIGARRLLVFGTASSIGTKVTFAPNPENGVALESFHLGYRRAEASVIPLQANDPGAGDQPDRYPSLYARLKMDQTQTSITSNSNGVTQFFAMGRAAANLAGRSAVQDKVTRTADASALNVVITTGQPAQ